MVQWAHGLQGNLDLELLPLPPPLRHIMARLLEGRHQLRGSLRERTKRHRTARLPRMAIVTLRQQPVPQTNVLYAASRLTKLTRPSRRAVAATRCDLAVDSLTKEHTLPDLSSPNVKDDGVACACQICLWCFHRIKDYGDGRCPACRTAYGDGEDMTKEAVD